MATSAVASRRVVTKRPAKSTTRTGSRTTKSTARIARSTRTRGRPRKKSKAVGKASPISANFPKLASTSCYGLGVNIVAVRRRGAEVELTQARLEKYAPKPGERPTFALHESTGAAEVARLATGLAHADRIRIARALACGAVTHHDLQKAVGIKTGPLYHHLRALERSGLVKISGRNEYTLTTGGRMLLLAATAITATAEANKSGWSETQLRLGHGAGMTGRAVKPKRMQIRQTTKQATLRLVPPLRRRKSNVP